MYSLLSRRLSRVFEESLLFGSCGVVKIDGFFFVALKIEHEIHGLGEASLVPHRRFGRALDGFSPAREAETELRRVKVHKLSDHVTSNRLKMLFLSLIWYEGKKKREERAEII